MIDQICAHIHNYFTAAGDIHPGSYTIQGGEISLPFLLPGQYFRIDGSALNDGVYKYPIDPTDEAQALADESFTGEIWAMKPPRRFIRLCEDIAAWQAKYGAAMQSPFQSESIQGAYSYTKASSADGSGAIGSGWMAAFRNQLNEWRCLY